MPMRKLNLSDIGFLLMEKRETPMHVGGINLYTLPSGADEQAFMSDIADILTREEPMRVPFGHKLKTGPAGLIGPVYWEPDLELDLDYHVRHSALPKPGRYRELFALVSRLHGTLLDRDRPLWEVHLIEGLQNRQFAVYSKMHHSMIDGIGAIHLTQSILSADPDKRIDYSPFSLRAFEKYRSSHRKKAAEEKSASFSIADIANVTEFLAQQWDTGVNAMTTAMRVAAVFAGRGGPLAMPWHNIPRTPINARVSGSRRFVAQSWPLERAKAIGKALGGTINDTVLAVCAGALKRYLSAEGKLPNHSLKAMTPVSIRREGDLDSSNAFAFVTADLATNIYDPQKRFEAIRSSMLAGKQMLMDLTPEQAQLFVQLLQVPLLLTTVTGMATRFPAFTTVISNVPGPRDPLFWNGAQLEGIYPASIPFDGFAMNITLVSYAGSLDFGITACRHSLPRVQRVIDYMEDAFIELEEVAGLAIQKSARATARSRKTVKAKTATATPSKRGSRKTKK